MEPVVDPQFQISINGKVPAIPTGPSTKACVITIVVTIIVFILLIWLLVSLVNWDDKRTKLKDAALEKAEQQRKDHKRQKQLERIEAIPICEPGPDSVVNERQIKRLVRKMKGQEIEPNDCVTGTPVYLKSSTGEYFVFGRDKALSLVEKRPEEAPFEFATGVGDYLDQKYRAMIEKESTIYENDVPPGCERLNDARVLIIRNDEDFYLTLERFTRTDGSKHYSISRTINRVDYVLTRGGLVKRGEETEQNVIIATLEVGELD